MALILYKALTDLRSTSAIASWPIPKNGIFPVESSNYFAAHAAAVLLAAGHIELAMPGAVDTTTPARIVRGQPGIHVGVSN
jgi:hypothetical protein